MRSGKIIRILIIEKKINKKPKSNDERIEVSLRASTCVYNSWGAAGKCI